MVQWILLFFIFVIFQLNFWAILKKRQYKEKKVISFYGIIEKNAMKNSKFQNAIVIETLYAMHPRKKENE